MKIVLTGGGTAGHAMVNAVLAPILKEREDKIIYIGSHKGAERAIMEGTGCVAYHPISTGKLRRYFSWENAKDFFRVWRGVTQAYGILKKEEADVVFSGGGYVSLPVAVAARMLKIPVLIRETDMSMGLANRICASFADKVYTTFPDALLNCGYVPCEYGGFIVRPELLKGKAPGIHGLPNVLVMGGSLGSAAINRAVWEGAERLAAQFNVDHLCGRGKLNPKVSAPNYAQSEYAEDMAELYAKADVVVTRCGSNAISEGLALNKRMVCIPLTTKAGRGEQIENAKFAKEHGCAVVLKEEHLCPQTLASAIRQVMQKPLNGECALTASALEDNCRKLTRAIQTAAAQTAESRMIRKLKRDQINWSSLTPGEFQLCAEIADEYYY